MNNIPLPDKFDFTDKQNATENWKLFKCQWKNYITLAEVCTTKANKISDDKIRLALFFSVIGGKAVKLINKICNDPSNVDEIISRLDDYFEEAKNVTYERYVFNSAKQEHQETCKAFINRLHEIVSKCDFDSLANLTKKEIEERLICDRLVAGVSKHGLRKCLLAKTNLTLDKATKLCVAEEHSEGLAVKISSAPFGNENKDELSEVNFKVQNDNMRLCKFCGNKHVWSAKNCPAYGKICNKCNKKNHFSKMCKQETKKIKQVQSDSRSRGSTSSENDNDEIYSVKDDVPKKRLYVNLTVCVKEKNKILKCQLDSGATCNVIGYDALNDLIGRPNLKESNTRLTFYGGASQSSLGKIQLHVNWKNKRHKMTFEVLKTPHNPLLGAQECLKLGLITLDEMVYQMKCSEDPNEIISSYPNIGKGLGSFEGLCDFKLDDSVRPVVVSPRRYPLALKEDIKREIKRLETLGVVKKVSEPTEWVSSMVVVKKPNKLRICIDPHQLNKAIKRPHYQTPTIEEVTPQLRKAKIFSKLDLKDGFWHVKLTEDASKLTTFWTPNGRYRWLRLPFGICSAPEEFQRRENEQFEGLTGVIIIADDVVVFGSGDTDEEALKDHNKNLKSLLERAYEKNIKFNLKKCIIGMKEIKYMGHVISADGLKPDPEKIIAVKKMKTPQSKEELQRFLGFVNYLGKFLPKLSEVSAPLRSLLKDESVWMWEKVHENTFKELINMVISAPTLQYYDVDKPATVQCDASQFGLGASLMQDGLPVAYISRTLSKTESFYAQIEKECLAVVYALERFEQYLFGKTGITVETDHKPLETIFKKPLTSAPKRLQRMLLRLQRFSFTTIYKPGKTMFVADFLSRTPLTSDEQYEDKDVQIFSTDNLESLGKSNSIRYLNVTDDRLSQIKNHTSLDTTMKKLSDTIHRGWPKSRKTLPDDLKAYWPFRDELSVEDGIILKGERIIVPSSLRQNLIKIIHSSHQGSDACIRRARDVFFWPYLSRDIRNETSSCKICKKYAPAQPREPLIIDESPERPWQKIAIDFAQEGSVHYLIVRDYYSSFFEVKKANKCSSETLITFCKELFARYGIPETVVADSGTPLIAQGFHNFAQDWKFKIVLSPPYHHQANGKAESAVKVFKNLLKKTRDDGLDFQKALLELRNTPLKDIGFSPVQLLMSRRTRSDLPINQDMLVPRTPSNVKELWNNKKWQYKKHYDHGAVELPSLVIGQNVWMKKRPQLKNEPWVEGNVVKKEGRRRYVIEVQGRLYTRNRRFLRT